MTHSKSSFKWGNLIVGVLFILTALISFRNPVGNLAGITVFFGMLAIVKGGFDLFFRNKVKKITGMPGTSLLIIGVFDIILGFLLLFNLTTSIMALPFVFATWFLVDSIGGLFSLEQAKSLSTANYWLQLILSIVGILISISLLFDPITSALTLSFLVGFYLMWIGIFYIVEAFS